MGAHHPASTSPRSRNEPFRFGWVVEIDPYDPTSVPAQAHRARPDQARRRHPAHRQRAAGSSSTSATTSRFEYVYKFVTAGRYARSDRTANLNLLDRGTLYVAKLRQRRRRRGTGTWLPLVHGQNGLTPDHGFATQADVLINARGAARRARRDPDGPARGHRDQPGHRQGLRRLHQQHERGVDDGAPPDAANPRPNNVAATSSRSAEDGDDRRDPLHLGHLHALRRPGRPDTYFAGFPKDQVSPIGSPDNITFDNDGNLWIATDGQPDALGVNDGLYAVPVDGSERGHVRMFATVPRGAEATGPAFSPDGTTFFAAIQHPGEGGSIAQPLSTWPDRAQPPRPSVITIRRGQNDPRIGA